MMVPLTNSLKHAAACRSEPKFSWGPLVLAGDLKLRLPGYANELTGSIKAKIQFAEGIPGAQQCLYNYSPKPLADWQPLAAYIPPLTHNPTQTHNLNIWLGFCINGGMQCASDQGSLNTCMAHACAKAICGYMEYFRGVELDANNVTSQLEVKANYCSRDPDDLFPAGGSWLAVPTFGHSAICTFRVKYTACCTWPKFIDELQRGSCMVFNVRDYPQGTRGLHALFSCRLKPNQQRPHAINSWNGTDPIPRITARQFVIAWKIELLN